MPSRGILGVGSALVDVLARVDDAFLPRVGGEKGGMVMVESERQDEWIAALPYPPAMAPGGAAGNILSLILSGVINLTLSGQSMGVSGKLSFIPIWLIAASLGFAVFVGMAAGYFPAMRAMKLSPLAAIRNE